MNQVILKGLTIMMIEDNSGDLESFRRVMDNEPIETSVWDAQTAEIAFDSLGLLDKAEVYPDLILLDLSLPGENGFEILSSLKFHQELRKIPVIILTMSRNTEDILKSWRMRAQSFVTKPDTLDGWRRIADIITSFWKHDDLPKLPFFF